MNVDVYNGRSKGRFLCCRTLTLQHNLIFFCFRENVCAKPKFTYMNCRQKDKFNFDHFSFNIAESCKALAINSIDNNQRFWKQIKNNCFWCRCSSHLFLLSAEPMISLFTHPLPIASFYLLSPLKSISLKTGHNLKLPWSICFYTCCLTSRVPPPFPFLLKIFFCIELGRGWHTYDIGKRPK